MNGDRELRLRQRIDALTDERDRARAQLAAVRRRRDRLAHRVYALQRSLAVWRLRAMKRAKR